MLLGVFYVRLRSLTLWFGDSPKCLGQLFRERVARVVPPCRRPPLATCVTCFSPVEPPSLPLLLRFGSDLMSYVAIHCAARGMWDFTSHFLTIHFSRHPPLWGQADSVIVLTTGRGACEYIFRPPPSVRARRLTRTPRPLRPNSRSTGRAPNTPRSWPLLLRGHHGWIPSRRYKLLYLYVPRLIWEMGSLIFGTGHVF